MCSYSTEKLLEHATPGVTGVSLSEEKRHSYVVVSILMYSWAWKLFSEVLIKSVRKGVVGKNVHYVLHQIFYRFSRCQYIAARTDTPSAL